MEWKAVVGYEGRYEVSATGLVRSLLHQSRWGPTLRPRPRTLKPDLTKGYLRVTLARDGRTERRSVHQLVLEAFAGPCPEGLEGSHKDGDRTNNILDNLCWETTSQNNLRKRQHGTAQRGERGGRAKLTEAQVLTIRAEYRPGVRGYGAQALGAKYGVDKASIQRIINRKTWTHI